MYPTVGHGLTSLSKLEAGAQSAGGWAHSSRHRTGPTGQSNKVTTPPLAILIWADLYFMGQILSELTRVQSGGGFGHKILFFKQHTIICLMQILQTTNNLPKDTGRFWKSVPMQCWDAAMRPAPGHVILLTIIIGPWTEQHQSVTSDHSSDTIQPASRICLHKENSCLYLTLALPFANSF